MAAVEPGSLDELRTRRLVLRRPTPADRDDLHRMHRDPKVMATLGGVRTEAETDTILRRLIGHWDANDFGYWIARDPETEAFAGRAGLRLLVVDERPEIELGYGFMCEHWGRGIATEVAAEIVRVGFEKVGTRELVCFTTMTNDPSRRVMEKVGFSHEKDFVHADLPHRLCRLDRARWSSDLEKRAS